MKSFSRICALVLAAGTSSRMGALKPVLLLDRTTLLETVVKLFQHEGVEDVRVVVGYKADEIEHLVKSLRAKDIFNSKYLKETFSSIAAGVKDSLCVRTVVAMNVSFTSETYVC